MLSIKFSNLKFFAPELNFNVLQCTIFAVLFFILLNIQGGAKINPLKIYYVKLKVYLKLFFVLYIVYW